MSQIEISIERLTLRPGDALVVRTPNRITPSAEQLIIEHVRATLKLDEAVPVLVLDGGASVEAVGQQQEIIR